MSTRNPESHSPGQQLELAEPKRVGRRPRPIDPAQLRALAALGHTREEASSVLGFHRNQLRTRMEADEALQQAWDEGRAEIAGKLRRAQVDLALKGNPIMLIWLGKNMLGQSDRKEITSEVHGQVSFVATWGGPRADRALPARHEQDVIEVEAIDLTADETDCADDDTKESRDATQDD